ncbi:ATP phosphoribosyltransferase regulatory subunit [Sphingomonas sp. ABOLD]|uniref:ATP phosphoribosyltransferase regulatory subunit n=1 Tax=Sphingomonas trueperi TaxID=53317 RepID=A0A7X6BBC7_9SPHN|nr:MULTISPECIES: ATP phosphoribosyltransferase regulatory subunit [Sphingomonas]NJB96030.1 ATP phosphoribosyltransferase regulatory subunit [Sphingomonas trueperi]RSV42735.1 ATP phosphoribosyltransferase regulatory subunit [Sphingomonas sp. ABOLD]RSV45015.1 ATP phosphoribosyltransferase regulatory subunit [Sphingomonas sp. ABOLE]
MTGLLPEGFHDRLPPAADAAARLETRVLGLARLYGYEQVDPPLAEFADELATRLKTGAVHNAVRFVDPVSQRSLAIRPDLTAQVGRIAATRMGHHPRPVRLCYAGQVLKLKAPALDPRRAMRQIGCELIGRDSVGAAMEIVRVAIEALQSAGVEGLAIDFTLPDLVDMLAGATLPPEKLTALRERLDAKDAGGVAAIDPKYLPLIEAAGPFDGAMAKLRATDAGTALASRIDGLAAIAASIPEGVALTLDPTERHGFEYQTWLGFSIFARGVRGEIGRGGTYTVVHDGGREEPAVGFSLYADSILDAGIGCDARRRLFLPFGTDAAIGAALRVEGWVTVTALDAEDTPEAQLCSHELRGGVPTAL